MIINNNPNLYGIVETQEWIRGNGDNKQVEIVAHLYPVIGFIKRQDDVFEPVLPLTNEVPFAMYDMKLSMVTCDGLGAMTAHDFITDRADYWADSGPIGTGKLTKYRLVNVGSADI